MRVRFLLSLVVLTGPALTAQAQFQEESRIGFKAGPGVSWIHRVGERELPGDVIVIGGGELQAEYRARAGWHAGFTYDYHFAQKFSIQTELLYAQQGERYCRMHISTPFGTSEPHDGSIRTDYLVLPVLIKWYAVPRLALQLGPQVGSLLQVRHRTEFPTPSGGRDVRESQDQGGAIDLGAVAGVAYEWERGFSLSVRYVHGVLDWNQYWGADYQELNRGLQLAAGYAF